MCNNRAASTCLAIFPHYFHTPPLPIGLLLLVQGTMRRSGRGGLGAFAQHCSLEELRNMLTGPLATNSGQPADRFGKAQVLASTAQHAPQR